ncbi:MAG: hypothetical protein D6805_01975 [Planctomycetota bacterium]|nr:MAG: hypothetical protein D6805_01975 [Planctomycetota bacterium]
MNAKKTHKRLWFAYSQVAVWACFLALGCQSTGKPVEDQPKHKTKQARKAKPKDPSVPNKMEEQGGQGDAGGQKKSAFHAEGDPKNKKALEDIAKGLTLKDQSRLAAANHYYKMAFKFYQELKYAQAERNLILCLQNNPNHQQAKILLGKVRYILGDRQGAVHDMARDYMQEVKVKIAQTRIELDRLFASAKTNFAQKNYKKAKLELERILELIQVSPYQVADETYIARVKEWIRKTERKRKEYEVERIRKLQEAAQERARFLHAQNLKYLAAQVNALYKQAVIAYRQEDYDNAIEIANEILYLKPDFTKASILRQQAMNAKYVKGRIQFIRQQAEHYARQIEAVDAASIPYQEVFRFPSREEWKYIQNRAAHVTKVFQEVSTSREEKDILSRLENQPISVNFKNTRFKEAIAFLRQITGLNFVITRSAESLIDDNDIKITLPLEKARLKNVLDFMMKSHEELTYKIEDGAIQITTKGSAKKKLFIHFYNVSDIINNLPEFPAPKLALLPQRGTAGGGAPVGGGNVDEDEESNTRGTGVGAEQLKELINKRIGESDEGTVQLINGVLIVRKSLEAHKRIQKLLDALRKTVGVMVTVEAKFIDIQDNLLMEIGVDYRGLPTNIVNIDGAGTNQNIGYRYLNAQGDNDTRAALVNAFSQGLGTTASNPFNITPLGGSVLQYTKLSYFQLEAIFEAVKKKQRARLVNAPRLNVFNTQRAHVLSIAQRAYIEDVEVQTSGVVPTLNPVIGVLNSGSILEARPTVSYDRKYVTLEIKPTLAVDQTTAANTTQLNLAQGNTNIPIELPILTVQKIRTTVTVPDGGTILVGGLKSYRREQKISGVPILSHVPILKNLFTRRGWTNLRRSLIVLLSVKIHVIRDTERRKFGNMR